MMLQIITYWGSEAEYKSKNVTLSKLSNPRSFDEFDINVISLRNSSIWCTKGHNKNTINCVRDLINISKIIDNSKTSKVVVILPQNCRFSYGSSSDELKYMCGDMVSIVSNLYNPFKYVRLSFEPTETKVDGEPIAADFCFDNVGCDLKLTESEKGKKITTINRSNVIFTTLDLDDISSIHSFLYELELIKKDEDIPTWIHEITFLNDEELNVKISDSKKVIEEEKQKIETANLALKSNERYKSILCAQGDELVEIVFEILKEMLDFDLSDFIDEKKADFIYETESLSFVGEIKGVSPNVKKQNVNQLETHCDDYIEEHPDREGKICGWLIINHQRTKPVREREPVHTDVINRADRNKVLIIETSVLLKLFEKYKRKEKTSEECIEILSNKTGILTEKDIE